MSLCCYLAECRGAGKHGVVERTVSVISQTPSDLHLEQLGDGKDAGIQGKKAVELV